MRVHARQDSTATRGRPLGVACYSRRGRADAADCVPGKAKPQTCELANPQTPNPKRLPRRLAGLVPRLLWIECPYNTKAAGFGVKGKDKVMGIKASGRFHHVSFVVNDLEKTARNLAATLSIKPWRVWTFHPDASTYHGRRVATSFRIGMAPMGEASFELIQPLSDDNVFAEHLRLKGEGLHHTCLAYDTLVSMHDAKRELERQRRAMVQSGSINGTTEFYHFEIPETGSVLELLYLKALPPPEKTITEGISTLEWSLGSAPFGGIQNLARFATPIR